MTSAETRKVVDVVVRPIHEGFSAIPTIPGRRRRTSSLCAVILASQRILVPHPGILSSAQLHLMKLMHTLLEHGHKIHAVGPFPLQSLVKAIEVVIFAHRRKVEASPAPCEL